MKQYVVLDLEMCKVPKEARGKHYNRANETIQIGAVLLNEKYQVIDNFNTYVKPEYGRLDSFIRSFTGISWENLKNAPLFTEAMNSFIQWIPEGDVDLVSWSDNDKFQLAGEMKYKGLIDERMENLFTHWIDSQVLYAEKIQNERCYSLEEALIICDISTVGQAHDGYFDAYNTAMLFKKLMTETELVLNNIFIDAKSGESKHLTCSLGDLFAGIDLVGVMASA